MQETVAPPDAADAANAADADLADAMFWASPSGDVLRALGTRESGLASDDASTRLRRDGPNLLRTRKPRSAFAILFAQVHNVIVALLAAAAAVSFVFGHTLEGAAVVGVLVLNTLIGFAMELRATRSMEALRRLGRAQARVRRDGDLMVVPADHVVVGDIIALEPGDVITTDARLIEGSKVATDESILTGESRSISKNVRPVDPGAHISERSCMLFKGTVVTRGSGEAVVVATGMQTELGKIARLVEETEDEETPLERRLDRLGRRLLWLTAIIVVAIALAGVLRGQDLLLVVSTAIALAVATVPEGLPVVATLALARGMRKMARRKALVRRLSAVETLGSTSVILTDKTGTLTENRMVVTRLVVDGATYEREADGVFVGPEAAGHLRDRALAIGVLCNNAELSDAGGVGDPLEVALLSAGASANIDRSLVARMPELREEPFDPNTRMMATFHRGSPLETPETQEGSLYVAVKGAVEDVLASCTAVATGRGPVVLDDDARAAWLDRHDALARGGLRVLALADKDVRDPNEQPYAGLTLVALIGMHDPPRRAVAGVIDAFGQAGVRVSMVTGDHPATAARVAEAVGLAPPDATVIVGDELDQALAGAGEHGPLLDRPVFARTSPRQKLSLIEANQRAGRIVAMVGDGVNDAPALRKANIGVAMGRRGTEVAKEAADMVLLDDGLGSVVAAIHEGRIIFDNIRRFVVYLLSCNVSELLAVGIAALVGLPLPLLPMQILFLNLVTDVFPALALGACPGEPDVTTRSPRPAAEQTLMPRHWRAIAVYGALLTAVVLGSLFTALHVIGLSERAAVTTSFATLGMAQTLHVFNMRSRRSSPLSNEVTKNRWVWGAIALCTALIGVAVLAPGMQQVLTTTDPGPEGWLLVAVMSMVPWGAAEAVRAVTRPAPLAE